MGSRNADRKMEVIAVDRKQRGCAKSAGDLASLKGGLLQEWKVHRMNLGTNTNKCFNSADSLQKYKQCLKWWSCPWVKGYGGIRKWKCWVFFEHQYDPLMVRRSSVFKWVRSIYSPPCSIFYRVTSTDIRTSQIFPSQMCIFESEILSPSYGEASADIPARKYSAIRTKQDERDPISLIPLGRPTNNQPTH